MTKPNQKKVMNGKYKNVNHNSQTEIFEKKILSLMKLPIQKIIHFSFVINESILTVLHF